MGICKKCGAPVQDEEELCEKCRLEEPQGRENQESYLDSLLHTIENTPLETDRRLPKKKREKETGGNDSLDKEESLFEENGESEEWPELGEIESLDEWETDDLDDFKDLDEDAELDEMLASEPQIEEAIDREIESIGDLEEQLNPVEESREQEAAFTELEPEVEPEKLDHVVEDFLEDLDRKGGSPEQQPSNIEEEALAPTGEGEKMEEEEVESQENDDDIMSLLNMIGGDDGEEEPLPSEEEESLSEAPSGQVEAEEESDSESQEDSLDDILSLLGEAEPDDSEPEPANMEEPQAQEEEPEDVFSLDDFMADGPEDEGGAGENEDAVSDIGDILSDSLSAVSSEQDEDAGLEELEQIISADAKEQKKKAGIKGLFGKLFGNVHDEKAKKALEKEEEREKERQAKKEAKKASKKGGKDEKAGEEGEGEEAEKTGKEKKAKKEKKEKKAKKEKQPKEEQVKELAEEPVEEETDEGRINRVGATIVFVFAAAFTIFTILGTNSFQYNLSIKNATDYFNVKKYNEAYGEVRGVEVKKKDEEIFNKIITVMYVNKQINSYNNYFNMKKYPEALDSLLKGLKRYDTYIAEAEELGIVKDFDYLKERIKKELAGVFGISEEEAYDIMSTSSRELYGKRVQEEAVVQ